MTPTNAHGQPIGPPVALELPRPLPPRTDMVGRFCRVVPTVPAHADGLFRAFGQDAEGRNWTYLFEDPIPTRAEFDTWLARCCASADPLYHTICHPDGTPVGLATYMRITPAHGVIEVGSIHFSPLMQGTSVATEAMYLMMARVFDQLGYRRYEWKCDALNAPSRRAAERLGFTFEGIFRQALVYKGRSRDTAWFSITDAEWPAVRAGFLAWLDPANFDDHGRQKQPLADLRRGGAPGPDFP